MFMVASVAASSFVLFHADRSLKLLRMMLPRTCVFSLPDGFYEIFLTRKFITWKFATRIFSHLRYIVVSIYTYRKSEFILSSRFSSNQWDCDVNCLLLMNMSDTDCLVCVKAVGWAVLYLWGKACLDNCAIVCYLWAVRCSLTCTYVEGYKVSSIIDVVLLLCMHEMSNAVSLYLCNYLLPVNSLIRYVAVCSVGEAQDVGIVQTSYGAAPTLYPVSLLPEIPSLHALVFI